MKKLKVILIIAAVIVVIGIISTFFKKEDPTAKRNSINVAVSTETEEVSSKSGVLPGFEVHYLDVGQGDAALILCDDEAMLIDGGASSKSDLIYTYLKKESISHLKYIIGTHPDDDHIGGLAGALNYADADTAYCSVDHYDGNEAFEHFVKYLGDTKIEVPREGTQLTLGSATGSIVGPSSDKQHNSGNNGSLIIKITYGNTSFLFTGDAESAEENDVVSSGENITSNVLKVSHHGSATSSTEEFLDAVNPQYAVLSCGQQNQYHHPDDQTLNRLKERGIKIYRTDMQGSIVCESDGENVSFTVERNESADTYSTYDMLNPIETVTAEPDTPASQEADQTSNVHLYILNTNTGRIHNQTCREIKKMKDKNKAEFTGTFDEVKAAYPDYSVCGVCFAQYND